MVKKYCSLLLSGLILITSLSSFGPIPEWAGEGYSYQQEQENEDSEAQAERKNQRNDPFEEEQLITEGDDSDLSLLTFNFLFYIVYKLKFVEEDGEDEVKPTD